MATLQEAGISDTLVVFNAASFHTQPFPCRVLCSIVLSPLPSDPNPTHRGRSAVLATVNSYRCLVQAFAYQREGRGSNERGTHPLFDQRHLWGGGVNLRRHPTTKLPRRHKRKYKDKIFRRLWRQEYIGTWVKIDPLVTYPHPRASIWSGKVRNRFYQLIGLIGSNVTNNRQN